MNDGISWQRPALIFFVIATVSGIFFAIITPPMRAPDEFGHFIRALRISHGELNACMDNQPALPMVSDLSKDLMQALLAADRSQPNGGRRSTASTIPTGGGPESVPVPLALGQRVTYGLAYLPQAFGVRIAADVTDDFDLAILAGRLSVLVTSIAVTVLAIRSLPFGRWTAVFIALLPSAVFLRSSLSIDALLMAIALLMIAEILLWRDRLSRGVAYSSRSYALLLACTLAVTLTKSTYAALLLLALAIPLRDEGRRLPQLARIGGLFAVATGATVLWGGHVASHCGLVRNDIDPAFLSIAAKKALMLDSPFRIANLFRESLDIPELTALFQQSVGVFGLLDEHMPTGFYTLAALLLAGIPLLERPHRTQAPLGVAILAVVAALMTALGLWVSLWLIWTPITAPRVWGMQGRYFLPILPCLGFALIAAQTRLRPGNADRPILAGWLTSGGALLLLGWAMAVQWQRGEFLPTSSPPSEWRIAMTSPPPLPNTAIAGSVDLQARLDTLLVVYGWAPWQSGDTLHDLQIWADFPIAQAVLLPVARPEAATAGTGEPWSGFSLAILSIAPIAAESQICLTVRHADGTLSNLENREHQGAFPRWLPCRAASAQR